MAPLFFLIREMCTVYYEKRTMESIQCLEMNIGV